MPRQARQVLVIPNIPHHVTQRGNNRQQVFFTPEDYRAFLIHLRKLLYKTRVKLHGYSLMPNHFHLVPTPPSIQALSSLLGRLEQSHALRLKVSLGISGHLWQDRFKACPMDESHFDYGLRYVDCNASRANLVQQPWDYLWSSASAHVTGHDPYGILDMASWRRMYSLDDWQYLIAQPLEMNIVEQLRQCTQTGEWFR